MMKVTQIKEKFCESGFYRCFWSAVTHPKNFIFLTKYPFWKSYNVWTHRFCGYQYTMYEWIPEGWRKAFGKFLTLDIVEALERDNLPRRKWTEELQWTDIKEKYGTLRLDAATTEKVQNVLSKYEAASMAYCQNCGAPARYVMKGYVAYLCEDCVKKTLEKYPDAAERLTAEDIPTMTAYHDGVETTYTYKERYGIDFNELWGLEND